MDLRTRIVGDGLDLDWLLAAPQLDTDDGLESAVLISLFTDALADASDELPGDSDNRRGWWGDSYPDVVGDRIGSRLWLLAREKQTSVVLQRVRDYARESLAWLIEDGIARSVEIDAEYPRQGVLTLAVTILRAIEGPIRFRFEDFWGAANAV